MFFRKETRSLPQERQLSALEELFAESRKLSGWQCERPIIYHPAAALLQMGSPGLGCSLQKPCLIK